MFGEVPQRTNLQNPKAGNFSEARRWEKPASSALGAEQEVVTQCYSESYGMAGMHHCDSFGTGRKIWFGHGKQHIIVLE